MSIKRNLAANFVANLWSAVISLLLVPIYIRFIGIEAYGLVGIYGSLQAMSSLLDMGFTTTMNREMARVSASEENRKEAGDLVRTLEVIYWGIAILIGVAVIALSPVLANHWLQTVSLSRDVVQRALVLIGLIMLCQWPFSFYAGGLMGLQRQTLLAGIQIVFATLRGVGAIIVLWLISSTIQAFFLWQILISAASTLSVALFLWRFLPASASHPAFRVEQLRKIWRFAAGISAISALGLALTQTDKIVLSKVLTLDKFGYYTLAGVVSASLYMLVTPVYNAVFPKMTQLATTGDERGLAKFYHQSTQTMSVILVPVVVILALFSREVLHVWTGDPATAANTYRLVTLLVIGTGLHGISHIPWALQLAYGWTRLGFYKNLISVVLLVPLIIIMALHFGAIGGAAMWVVVNLGEVLISQQVMHRRLLKGELRRWYTVDVGVPLATSLLIALVGRILIRGESTRGMLFVHLAVVSACTLVAAALASPIARSSIAEWLTVLRRDIFVRKTGT